MKFDRDIIEKKLKKLPKEYSVAFALRCALRAVPLIGYKGNFDFWKEDKRKDYAFAVIRALDFSELFLYDKDSFNTASAASASASASSASYSSASSAYSSAYSASAAYSASSAYSSASS
ncbi:MAG: hypothetical protein JRJ49_10425, partial [Deltaproteobacteria bacterium]|nr:hypothetical protein [Deltaproteobacteria bacterium]